jgi:acyl carrier protein
MDENEVREKLRSFIMTELIHQPNVVLEDNQPIVSSGLINSFSLAEIGMFIETEFDVYIPDAELTMEKMDTLDLIVMRVMHNQ